MGAVALIVRAAAVVVLLLAATPAVTRTADAQEPPKRRFCPNRPSLAESGCTTLPGQVQVEMSGIDGERDDDAERREDRLLYGDILARIGVAAHSELQVGWTPWGVVRTRDKASGAVERAAGSGDVRLAWRRALSHPDGKALSSAIQPFVTLPVGHRGVGDGDWAAGVTVPVQWRVDTLWTLELTSTARAAVDEDGRGRHFDAVAVAGIGYALGRAVRVTGEVSVERDDDPAGRVTRPLLAASLSWQPRKRTQIDMLAVAGITHDAPDARLVFGGAILF